MNKRKKSRDSNKKKEEVNRPKDKIFKFNFSNDNLKCFINDRHSKTDRKKVNNRYNFNLTDEKKCKEDSNSNDSLLIELKIKRQLSPDLSLEASNLIIQQIQKNGLKCAWNQIEQTKTDVSNQQERLETQIFNLAFSAFSERSYSFGKSSRYTNNPDQFLGYYSQSVNQSLGSQAIVTSDSNEYLGQSSLSKLEYSRDNFTQYDDSFFRINLLNIGNDPRTTLMVRNIPNKYTIQYLSSEIDHNFSNTYDFLYLPYDIKNNCNVGYGFINFLNTEFMLQFYQKFHNKKWLRFRSDKICMLAYARLQGLSRLIEHFQNSKVLNHKDKRYQPIIKDIKQSQKIQLLIKQQKIEQSLNKK